MSEEPPKRLFGKSALICFVPRQIMLENLSTDSKRKEEKMMKKKRTSPSTLENGLEANGGELPQDRKGALICSIASYLEEKGFSKTLAVFQSEAQIEIYGQKAPYWNLEHVFCKFMESISKDDTDRNINGPNEEDSQKSRISRKDNDGSICDASSEAIHKKKKKKRSRVDGDAKVESNKLRVENGSAICSDFDGGILGTVEDELHKDANEKKKKKPVSDGHFTENTEVSRKIQTSSDKVDVEKFKSTMDSSDQKVVLEESVMEGEELKSKKRSGTDLLREDAEKVLLESGKEVAREDLLSESHVKSKDKKKKKSKQLSVPADENPEQIDSAKLHELSEEKVRDLALFSANNSNPLDESNATSKVKKKKRNKLVSDSLVGSVEQLGTETLRGVTQQKSVDPEHMRVECETDCHGTDSVPHNASSENPLNATNSESKDKKKRRHKATAECLHAGGKELLDGGNSHDGTSSIANRIDGDSSKSSFKGNDDQISMGIADNVVKKGSKKRKRVAPGETKLEVYNEATAKESEQNDSVGSKGNKEMEQPPKLDVSLEATEILNSSKKRKTDVQEESNKSSEKSPSKQLKVLAEHKGSPAECGGHKKTNQQDKNDKDEAASKIVKTEDKCSAEPKTIKAFQRVKIDDVQFADERLQDNSYWAKHGADSGYGAKAQEILGQVRGRDFRHEKTKKKRGTYRGGQIDLQSHSIKFNYSDED